MRYSPKTGIGTIEKGGITRLAHKQDPISKYGKPAAKIIRFNKEPWNSKMPERITVIRAHYLLVRQLFILRFSWRSGKPSH